MADDVTFSEQDRIDSLTPEQLALLSRARHDILIWGMRENPGNFDVEQIRILMDLGVVEAKRRRDALTGAN